MLTSSVLVHVVAVKWVSLASCSARGFTPSADSQRNFTEDAPRCVRHNEHVSYSVHNSGDLFVLGAIVLEIAFEVNNIDLIMQLTVLN